MLSDVLFKYIICTVLLTDIKLTDNELQNNMDRKTYNDPQNTAEKRLLSNANPTKNGDGPRYSGRFITTGIQVSSISAIPW